jgi:hypothetical protein
MKDKDFALSPPVKKKGLTEESPDFQFIFSLPFTFKLL